MTEVVRDRLRTVVLPDRAGDRRRRRGARRRTAPVDRSPNADRARVIFAAAASQSEMLAALARADGIDWARVEAFHLDEYVGLPLGHAALLRHSGSRSTSGHASDPAGSRSSTAETPTGATPRRARYGALLADGGLDLALLGIGENGHVAFNDPHVADFDDPLVVKPVEIDETSRRQQVRDGAFDRVRGLCPGWR